MSRAACLFRLTASNDVCVKKVNFEINIADRKASIPVYRQSLSCSAELTPQHYHWYAATRFALTRRVAS